MRIFAAGLSLIFGVMRLVNLAHGDLIVLGAYVILLLMAATGFDPFLAAFALAMPLHVRLGYGLQRLLLNRTLGDDILPPLLVTFGLSIIIQNGLLAAVLGRQPPPLEPERSRRPRCPSAAAWPSASCRF